MIKKVFFSGLFRKATKEYLILGEMGTISLEITFGNEFLEDHLLIQDYMFLLRVRHGLVYRPRALKEHKSQLVLVLELLLDAYLENRSKFAEMILNFLFLSFERDVADKELGLIVLLVTYDLIAVASKSSFLLLHGVPGGAVFHTNFV